VTCETDKELAKALARIDVLMTEKAKLRYSRPFWARLFLKGGVK
jgi:hypothetical protein